jgi:hypothetical protein
MFPGFFPNVVVVGEFEKKTNFIYQKRNLFKMESCWEGEIKNDANKMDHLEIVSIKDWSTT